MSLDKESFRTSFPFLDIYGSFDATSQFVVDLLDIQRRCRRDFSRCSSISSLFCDQNTCMSNSKPKAADI